MGEAKYIDNAIITKNILCTITRLADKFPEQRIGQIIDNARARYDLLDLFYVSNTDLFKALLKYEETYDNE